MKRVVPILSDFGCVLVFAIAGRASHGLDWAGLFSTAWPFLVACAVAWLILTILADNGWGPRAAVVVWLVTAIGGLALRVTTGDTAAWAFVVVATLTLAALLGGWRLLAALIGRARRR